jgi:hypothetical protein
MTRSLLTAAALLAAAAGLSGCGPTPPKLVPVAGRVTLTDGTPIKHGYVILHADEARGNATREVCQGKIVEGEYTVLTGPREGAPAGWYKVTIEASNPPDEKNPYFTEWLADEKYVYPEKSKLAMEVVENPEPNRYDYKLDPHPQRKKK